MLSDTGVAMRSTEGAGTFQTSGGAYDAFMGRYSAPLADLFADFAGIRAGQFALDVGCGPGALTRVLVERLGAESLAACDPSPPFVAECAARYPGVDVRSGKAEALPFDDAGFDAALSQLVLHFVSDASAAASELRRVTRPGGTVAACVWDFDQGMQMLRAFWDAALALDPSAPDEARVLRFSRRGEIPALFAAAGLVDIAETTLQVRTTYVDIDELWSGFLAGIGPAGAYCVSRTPAQQAELRGNLIDRLGAPDGPFTLTAIARAARGQVPS